MGDPEGPRHKGRSIVHLGFLSVVIQDS